MSQSNHTYGPTCHLAPAAVSSTSQREDCIPHLNSQFFYSSPLHLDDLLSAVPTAASDAKSIKHAPRPFSTYDNKALEEAWQGLVAGGKRNYKKGKESAAKNVRGKLDGSKANELESGSASRSPESKSKTPKNGQADLASSSKAGRARSKNEGPAMISSTEGTAGNTSEAQIDPGSITKVSKKARKGKGPSHGREIGDEQHSDGEQADPKDSTTDASSPSCCEDMGDVDENEQENCVACQLTSASQRADDEKQKRKQPSCAGCLGEAQADGTDEKGLAGTVSDVESAAKGKSSKSSKFRSPESEDLKKQLPATSLPKPDSVPDPRQLQGTDSGMTGSPFVKLPSRPSSPQPQTMPQSQNQGEPNRSQSQTNDDPCDRFNGHERETTGMETETVHIHTCKAKKSTKYHAEVPVGISRLHKVTLPALQMKPIYWSPVSDIAAVSRGTWFYKTTMYPVEPAVANQLEAGYRELRPWSQTWKDELNSAIEVGAVGEEKIAHKLWPKEEEQKGKLFKASECQLSSCPYCAAKCFHGDSAAEGSTDPNTPEKSAESKVMTKKYANAQVIYKDDKDAFILKPNLQPSAYYGRKPLQKIKRGTSVGIPVVRGFDWKTWHKLYPSKRIPAKVEEHTSVSGDADTRKGDHCPACRAHENQPKVTDLVLVIHGIGQKLSERVESFHFTHAINDFRRSINVELADKGVQRVLRNNLGGVMTLPVNWRSNLSFEDGGLLREGDKKDSKLDYSLPDVTQESLPSVRKMISDVMLDIPYYMSAHKPKMIQAVVQEANRIYSLWCKNNPEFEKEGRVHVIAHSLGSAMAVEILSKQPTSVPKLNLGSKKINTKHFDFNTCNLFLAGSPVGFFLLLEQCKLLPRRGQNKPGAEHGDDSDKNIAGESGKFGCLAVDNIYNIMHYNDPIAYRLNATVDKSYADSLKDAQVPSASTGFFESIGNAMREILPGVSGASEVPIGQVAKPAGVARLPSQLEMEVHDFTREEIAEKKFFLLNDNGQVDWYLNSGRGPLEIQYLNMLGAHSSYWLSPDFVRFVVIEVGRKPGKTHCLPSMKASKITRK